MDIYYNINIFKYRKAIKNINKYWREEVKEEKFDKLYTCFCCDDFNITIYRSRVYICIYNNNENSKKHITELLKFIFNGKAKGSIHLSERDKDMDFILDNKNLYNTYGFFNYKQNQMQICEDVLNNHFGYDISEEDELILKQALAILKKI